MLTANEICLIQILFNSLGYLLFKIKNLKSLDKIKDFLLKEKKKKEPLPADFMPVVISLFSLLKEGIACYRVEI